MNASAEEYRFRAVAAQDVVRCSWRTGSRPRGGTSESAYIAPTAVLAFDVTVGSHSRAPLGAVITAEGGPVEIRKNCVIMENLAARWCPGPGNPGR